MAGRLRIVLTLEDHPPPSQDGWPQPPAAVRLKRLLKLCLRAFGFKAVDVRQVPPEAGGAVKGGGGRMNA